MRSNLIRSTNPVSSTLTRPLSHVMTVFSSPTVAPESASISDHASGGDAQLRKSFGPRVRRLHARIGKAHHQAEGMAFSRALLAGTATPLQLAALIRALLPAYALLEEQAPQLAATLGATTIPWDGLSRVSALQHDVARLAVLPQTPDFPAAAAWHERLALLADQQPHRLMAHVYVRYGGDLSGGQQLALQAQALLERQGLPSLEFWEFESPTPQLKQALHAGFEQLQLTESQDEELLEEAEAAFLATQQLLAELAALA